MNHGRYILHDLDLDSQRAIDGAEVVALAKKYGRIVKHASDLFPRPDKLTTLIGTRYIVERIKREKTYPVEPEYRPRDDIDPHFTQDYQRWFALEWTAMQHMFGVV